MTDTFTQNSSDSLPAQLAAAAGAGELAAAAAIDAEEGDRFLHGLLADQMAAVHLLTMRMAATADRAISEAANGGGLGDDNLPIFDLAAARFAGAAARLNGRYCRGLQTLRALAAPDEAEVEWVGVNLPILGPHELSPEEKARRINRGKFYLKQRQAEQEPEQASSSRRRPIDAAEQAMLAAAESAARDLVAATGVKALGRPSNAQHAKLFAHQLAAAHRLMMRLSGRADAVVVAAADPLDRPEGLRLAHGAARLMERFRQGVGILNRMRTDPDGPRRTEYYYDGPLSAYRREEERAEDIAAGIDPDTGLPAGTSAAAGLPAGASARAGAPVLLRRGRLNNGNPGGDFLAAPPLRRPDARRPRLPPAGHGQRPPPLPRRQEHGRAHRGRADARPPRPPRPRPALGR